MGIRDQAVKRQVRSGGGSHRLHVSPEARVLWTSPPWFCYAQPNFQFCAPHPLNPRHQCEFCFSLLLTPGPVSGPPWALAWWFEFERGKDTRFRERALGTVSRSTLGTGRQSKSTGLDVHENSSRKEALVTAMVLQRTQTSDGAFSTPQLGEEEGNPAAH